MPELTRRRYPERPDCWHVYCGDVQVGTISVRPGVPVDVDQWGWQCGFYPPSRRGQRIEDTAASFDQARADFEAAWQKYLPRCTPDDFDEYRRQRAWTARASNGFVISIVCMQSPRSRYAKQFRDHLHRSREALIKNCP